MRRKEILFYCDNDATVHIKQGQVTNTAYYDTYVMFNMVCCIGNFIITAKHIPGIYDGINDALSQVQLSRLRCLAPGHSDQAHMCGGLGKPGVFGSLDPL